MRFLYKIAFSVFAVFYLPVFFLKKKHKDNWHERFGQVSETIVQRLKGKDVIWVHAVSVGEVSLAVRLIDTIKERHKNLLFVLTVTTAAGREAAMKLKGDEDEVLYFPADFGFAVRSFIRSVRPKALVILETEIWPNLIHELSRRSIPIYIVNARISDKAIYKYRWARGFMKRVLARVSAIGAQDQRMKDRFVSVGADARQVQVTGNMKFDWRPSTGQADIVKKVKLCLGTEPFLLIGGSTHQGEETALLDVTRSLRREFPSLKLMLAPRHLDRIEKVVKEVEEKGFKPVRLSTLIEESAASDAVWDGRCVLILDKIGILSSLYEIADAVFIGGSLVEIGGHNLVEPAFFEKPVLHGPFMENFLEMVDQFQEEQAAIQVDSAQQLESRLRELMLDTTEARAMGRRAKTLVLKHQGATEKNVELLRGVLT